MPLRRRRPDRHPDHSAAKPKAVTEAELRAEWRQRAGDHRFDVTAVPHVPRTAELRVSDDDLAAELTAPLR